MPNWERNIDAYDALAQQLAQHSIGKMPSIFGIIGRNYADD